MIFILDSKLQFPDPKGADPEGLLAVGGDLRPERLLLAYRQGIFPWSHKEDLLLWWSPDPRAVFFPDQFHCSRSLKKELKKRPFCCKLNRDFLAVIQACALAKRQDQEGTWIFPSMIEAYLELFRLGYAHCFEVFVEDKRWGGVYGVLLGKVFFAESMFSEQTNGSKVALVYLMDWAKERGVELIDCQFLTEHLASLGARNLSRTCYLEKLRGYFGQRSL